MKLKTIQPVSHLQQYNKYIAPVLKNGYSVHLTKGGENYWTISPDNGNQSNSNDYASKLVGMVVEHRLNKLAHSKKYTISQAKKMVDKF